MHDDGQSRSPACADVKGTPHKWLDLRAAFGAILPKPHRIVAIKYFTAGVSGKLDPRQVKHAHFVKHLGSTVLAASQLPSAIPGTNIRKPARW